jgi:hypothetical protein
MIYLHNKISGYIKSRQCHSDFKILIYRHVGYIRRCYKLNSVAFSPQANYTDRATAACRRI